MKVRLGFVTNSSSSSFLVCFARVADKNKAANVLDKYKNKIEVYTGEQVLEEINTSRWRKWLEWDYAGIDATPSKEYVVEHIDDTFIVIEDYNDLYEDEDGYADYDVYYEDFNTEAVDNITEENGFADIDVQYGAGRNG